MTEKESLTYTLNPRRSLPKNIDDNGPSKQFKLEKSTSSESRSYMGLQKYELAILNPVVPTSNFAHLRYLHICAPNTSIKSS